MTTCDRCGAALTIGDFPFCPHGRGVSTAVGDEIDIVIENNGTPQPIRFRSRVALKRHLDAHGLVPKVRHVPLHQGTDKSPHTTNWAAGIDPYTMESARVLLSRPNSRQVDPPAPTLPVDLSIRVLETVITGKYTDE